MYDYFGNGLHDFCNERSKAKLLSYGDPGTKAYLMVVRGLICVTLGILNGSCGSGGRPVMRKMQSISLMWKSLGSTVLDQ